MTLLLNLGHHELGIIHELCTVGDLDHNSADNVHDTHPSTPEVFDPRPIVTLEEVSQSMNDHKRDTAKSL